MAGAGILKLAAKMLAKKLASKERAKNIRLYRTEPLPSSGEPNFKYLPGDERAFGKHFGQWFTPDKKFVKNWPGMSPDASKGIKSIVIPRKDLQKYNAVNVADIKADILQNNKNSFNLVDDVGEVVLPPELAMKAKYNFFDSLPYIFNYRKKGSLYTKDLPVEILGLKRFFELLKLKAQGKKSGGIVSFML
jgi:hypothetical protein